MSLLLRSAYLQICNRCGGARIARDHVPLCEPFWTKPDGLDAIRELKSDGNIDKEEFDFLYDAIQDSKLAESRQQLKGLAAIMAGFQDEPKSAHDKRHIYH